MDPEKAKSVRDRMVSQQLEYRGIVNPDVLNAMRIIPRHEFVTPDLQDRAYHDTPLAIGQNQTISQPYIVALMTQLLLPQPDDVILEIGTGSGYQAAVLSMLVRQVYTVERIPELAEKARTTLERIGVRNVSIVVSDGSIGLGKFAPYEGIMVTAAAPAVPEPLKDQLSEGGRLIIPTGRRGTQYLERWTRSGGKYEREQLIPVAFVPLIGQHGWSTEN